MVQNNGVTLRRGSLSATVSLDAEGVRLDISRADRAVLSGIRLGVTVGGGELAQGAELLHLTQRDVVETWEARSGKARGVHSFDHAEATLRLRSATGTNWQLRIRVGETGVAVRYALDDLQGLSSLDADGTRIPLPADGRAWVLDYQTWYETPRRGVDLADLPAGEYGFPFLARLGAGDDHVLVTESGIDGRFSGAHPATADGVLAFTLADASVEIARGDVTPWRVFLVGDLADIVGSLFVDELADAAAPAQAAADWVRPGRAAWSWWSDFYSGAQLDRQKHFVDVAAELGWEHLLIDCGWEETWVPEIVSYASVRGIQVHLWTVWHDLDGPAKLARLALWRSWGVAGIKVDFMESEAKDRYRWYDTVLTETARLGLMVNFHGSVIPRGWSRTWPQVIGYEAIRGSEYYVFYNDTPLTAAHNVIQPFTRNVLGAMDYTPVAFTAPGRTTSDGHELGLSVAFECGITHFADDVDAYREQPLAARFLAELAPSWDETVLLAGTPDTEAVVARRSGDRWFLGCIATGAPRRLTVPVDRLGLGEATAWVVGDQAGASGLTEQTIQVGGTLEVDLVSEGGFVAILAAAGTELFRATPRVAGAFPSIEPILAELERDRATMLTVGAESRLRVAPGWQAASLGGGRWRVAADPEIPSGAVGVVTVEEQGPLDEVPRVAHARLVVPLVPGEHVLSTLPMLSFSNESGPVERDMSNGGGNPADGLRISIAGAEHDDGLGVSTPSTADFFVGGRATRLTAQVGVDDETPGTRCVALVLGDGIELVRLELEAGSPSLALDVDVTGVRILSLATAPHGGADTPAHVDWASARIHVAPEDLHTTPDPGH